MIQQMKAEYPLRQLCATLDCPTSTAYYVARSKDESDLVGAIELVLMRFPFYGYRKVHKELLRRGVRVGEQVVRRLLREMGVTRSVGKVRVQTTDSNHPHPRYPNRIKGLKLKRPNQVWVADITYIRLGRRFIYLTVILDAYTRAVRGWALSRTIDQQLTRDALDMALAQDKPSIFHSDQGSQYAAWLHTDRLLEHRVKISMSDKASPTQNGLVERFIRTLKEEHVDYSEYRDFDDVYRQISYWLEVVYMRERIHQALDYLTPVEFEVAARAKTRYPLLSPA
jgi:transposase InsO family protein